MSLYHVSCKLNQLSDRRYSKGRSDIPKILNNYYRYVLDTWIQNTRGNKCVVTYIRTRAETFQPDFMSPGEPWVPQIMPGDKVRSQWWIDPRVEFGLQNKRERR